MKLFTDLNKPWDQDAGTSIIQSSQPNSAQAGPLEMPSHWTAVIIIKRFGVVSSLKKDLTQVDTYLIWITFSLIKKKKRKERDNDFSMCFLWLHSTFSHCTQPYILESVLKCISSSYILNLRIPAPHDPTVAAMCRALWMDCNLFSFGGGCFDISVLNPQYFCFRFFKILLMDSSAWAMHYSLKKNTSGPWGSLFKFPEKH